MANPLHQRASAWLDAFFIALLLAVIYFVFLGSRPLFVPDEGRYAEIAREMVANTDYVTPYLNGIKYFEKPVLYYWLEAIAIQIGGLNLWSVRSVNALLAILGCVMTYLTARKLYNRQTGILASLILGTSLLYVIMARMISLDLTVTVFLSLSLYAFILGCQLPMGPKRRLYFWSSAIAAALAVLTKGLIGLVFPLIIIGSWLLLTWNWAFVKRMYLPSSLLIFVLVVAPWHVLVDIRNPEFFYFYFIEQHFLRYTTMDVGHYQPVWFFIPYLLIGFFPWIVFLPQAIATCLRNQQERQTALFFLLWAILIFAFFSFSKSKLIPYILPVFPPLAILTGRYLASTMTIKSSMSIKYSYFILMLISVMLAGFLYTMTRLVPIPHPHLANPYLYGAATILLMGILASTWTATQNTRRAFGITIATTALFMLAINGALPAIDSRSILPLANYLKPRLRAQDEVVTFNLYYQDLPFYLQRRVSILNWRNELSYGMQHQAKHDWMLNGDTFWALWHSSKRVYVFMNSKQYEELPRLYPKEKFYLLDRTATNVLVSNQP